MIIAPGTVDVTTYFKLVDPAAGTPETGLDVTTLDATYVRDRAAAVKADLALLGGVAVAHANNSAIQVDAVNAPGLYRVDWPDAAFATGVHRAQLVVNGASIDPAVIEVELALWLTPITGATVRAVDDADGSLPTAAEVVNEWETQSQADPTGFHVNTMEIESADATDTIRDAVVNDATRIDGSAINALTGVVNIASLVVDAAGNVASDVVEISGDSGAADNLELDYDGTGYAKANSTIGTTTLNTDMVGTDNALLAASAPANWGVLSITAITGRVDVAEIEGADATDQIRDSILDDATRFSGADIDQSLSTTESNIRGADNDDLKDISDEIDAVPTATENADGLLRRDWTAVAAPAARSALNALRFLRNRWRILAGTLTVYEEDDATPSWTGPVTTAASDPVNEIDPT